ncbi:MAG: replication-relaxation family protein [Candidatus Saccharimonadales bacterium]
MKLSDRDLQIIRFAARFGQVTKQHVRAVIFADNVSATPCDRAMKRLVDQRLLARIEIRTVGGANGGSGQYVFQVGSAGWNLAETEGSYWLSKSVKYHSLAIADIYCDIYNKLDIVTYSTEPDTHEKINYVAIQPDMYVVLNLAGRERRAWIEADLGTERPKQLRDKMARYNHAWNGAPERWNPWPFVIWIVPDVKRRAELESLIKLEPAESQGMYRVCLFEDVVQTLAS